MESKTAQNSYRILFERSPDAVIVAGPDGRVLDHNPAARAFLGVSESGLYGADITAFYANRDDRERLTLEAREAGLVHDAAIIFVDKAGRLKHSLITMMRLDAPDGSLYGYQSIIHDVTKRRLAQKRLENQKNYADQLIDMAPEAIAIQDLEERVVRVNEEFCNLFYYAKSDCLGRRIDELIVPDHLKAESLSLSARAIGGACFEIETQRMRKDGSLVDVSVLIKPIATENDEPAAYVIYRDISARIRAQEALRKSGERHRTVLEAAPDPVMVLDMDGQVIYLNQAFTRVFGWH
ncbi:MAG: hypothetical protein CR984_06410, partial [Proteobacteria bacterium]